jgi:protein-S-isoprenylcysteine O-methyltransferase Ste14
VKAPEAAMKMSPTMAVVVILSTLAYLAIVVFGAGGIDVFLARPQFVAFALVTIALALASLWTEGGIRSGEREDRGNRWVLIAFMVIGLVWAYLPAYTDRIGFWTLDGDSLRWFGVALYAAGGVLRIWPVFVLGRRFSGLVAIQSRHSLVTAGIYRVVRHPSYLGALVFMLGGALVFRSGVGILIVAATLVPMLARIASEEALLRSQFGAEYDAYRARTWRLVPFVY